MPLQQNLVPWAAEYGACAAEHGASAAEYGACAAEYGACATESGACATYCGTCALAPQQNLICHPHDFGLELQFWDGSA